MRKTSFACQHFVIRRCKFLRVVRDGNMHLLYMTDWASTAWTLVQDGLCHTGRQSDAGMCLYSFLASFYSAGEKGSRSTLHLTPLYDLHVSFLAPSVDLSNLLPGRYCNHIRFRFMLERSSFRFWDVVRASAVSLHLLVSYFGSLALLGLGWGGFAFMSEQPSSRIRLTRTGGGVHAKFVVYVTRQRRASEGMVMGRRTEGGKAKVVHLKPGSWCLVIFWWGTHVFSYSLILL